MDKQFTAEEIEAADKAGVEQLKDALDAIRQVLKEHGVTMCAFMIGKPSISTPAGERTVTLFDYEGDTTFVSMMLQRSLSEQAGVIHQRTHQMIAHIASLETALGMDKEPADKGLKVFHVPGKDIVH